jgi:hypothetical protein
MFRAVRFISFSAAPVKGLSFTGVTHTTSSMTSSYSGSKEGVSKATARGCPALLRCCRAACWNLLDQFHWYRQRERVLVTGSY